jgi:uncharacterized integral membrane protein
MGIDIGNEPYSARNWPNCQIDEWENIFKIMFCYEGGLTMWIFRYFLPGIFAVALGVFVAQNLEQRTTIQFLFWRFYDVPIVLIMAVAFVIGLFIRFYVIFVKLLEKKRLERATQKIIAARKAEKDLKAKKDYSKDIEDAAEERMRKRIEDEKPTEAKKEE